MSESKLAILGVGQTHPDTVIDNAFLESLDIGTTNDWILERVGIEKRHSVLPLDYIRQTRNQDPRAAVEAAQTTLTELGAAAARAAIEQASISTQEIGLVINGMSIPQMCIPANACMIAADLGITAPSFDLNSACSTFAAQVHFLNNMNFKKLPDYILLVQSETYTLTIDYKDRNTAVLFGDGATAQILSTRHPGKAYIVNTLFESDPAAWNKVFVPMHKHFLQEGSAVQRFAILQTVKTYQDLLKESEFRQTPYFIGHQANLRMLETACKRMDVSAEKHFYNINLYGNCGGSGAPSVLADHWNDFNEGDDLIIATVGAGLSWGGAVLRFGEQI